MTAKDFKVLADIIRDLPTTPENRSMMAHQFANELHKRAKHFNSHLFMQACGGSLPQDDDE